MNIIIPIRSKTPIGIQIPRIIPKLFEGEANTPPTTTTLLDITVNFPKDPAYAALFISANASVAVMLPDPPGN